MAKSIIDQCSTCMKPVQIPLSRALTFKSCSKECRKIYLSNKNKSLSEARFWDKVNKKQDIDCWEWIGHRNHKGYGLVNRNGVVSGAHRLAYTLINGSIPDGMEVMHKCDNRACCNPSHLQVGTHKENIIDCVTKGRRFGQVLTQELVDKIRAMYLRDGIKQIDISRILGIKKATISSAIIGKNWNRTGVPSQQDLKAARKLIRKSYVPMGRAKLSKDEVNKIRKEFATGTISQHSLAKKYSVSPMCVNRIVNNKSWKANHA